MSMVSAVGDYFKKTADARFKRDALGRLVFFPWGFGRGRLVPDAAVEARLRYASQRVMVAILFAIVPAVAIVNSVYQLQGLAFAGYIIACSALGFVVQAHLAWLARNLQPADERISYVNAMLQSLDRFGRKFLIFGLVSSLLFVAIALVMLVVGAAPDRLTMAFCLVVFAPMALLYGVALKRRTERTAA